MDLIEILSFINKTLISFQKTILVFTCIITSVILFSITIELIDKLKLIVCPSVQRILYIIIHRNIIFAKRTDHITVLNIQ